MATTISDEISKRLAEDIINGVFKPGQKLEEQAIARRFDVSRTPVRDAFKQLIGTGLIESRPHRGVTVVDLELDQLSYLFEALGEVEAICARFSAQRMNVIERKNLENLYLKEAAVLAENDDMAYYDYNEEVHSTIHHGAHNPALIEIARDLRRRLSPFRRSMFFREGNLPDQRSMEHDELIRAILEGDMEGAYQAMSSHVANSALNAIDHLSESRGGD
jgi:DNA-binding GntR family transcriptional regulator